MELVKAPDGPDRRISENRRVDFMSSRNEDSMTSCQRRIECDVCVNDRLCRIEL